MKNILFIGTSFLGAIKEGWDSLYSHSSCYTATFLGLDAPSFVVALQTPWTLVDNKIVFPESLEVFLSEPSTNNGGVYYEYGRPAASKTFEETYKASAVSIDLEKFDCIVFVDMFFRYNQIFDLTKEGYLSFNEIPISDRLLGSLRLPGFNGFMNLSSNKRFGNVEFQNSRKVIELIAKAIDNDVYLVGSPRPPVANVDLISRYGSIDKAKKNFNFIERFYKNELSLSGIEFICQPISVLDDNLCLTPNYFSKGPHKNGKPSMLDPHMNRDYGENVVEYLIQEIERNEQK